MNKSDLNSSMLFKIRDNGLCALLERNSDNSLVFYDKNRIRNGNSGGVSSLKNDYDDNLIFLYNNNPDYDIIAIKQYDSCTQVINIVLNDKEPEEWDWVENTKEDIEENSESQTVNFTVNINIDSKNEY